MKELPDPDRGAGIVYPFKMSSADDVATYYNMCIFPSIFTSWIIMIYADVVKVQLA